MDCFVFFSNIWYSDKMNKWSKQKIKDHIIYNKTFKHYMIIFDNIFEKNTKIPFAGFEIQDFSHLC